MTDASSERHRLVARMLPDSWDQRPFSIASELRAALDAMKDEGTSIDSGGSDGHADLWATVQGVEYYITVRQSNKQKSAT